MEMNFKIMDKTSHDITHVDFDELKKVVGENEAESIQSALETKPHLVFTVGNNMIAIK